MLLPWGSVTLTLTRAFWVPSLPSRTVTSPIVSMAAGTRRSSRHSTESRQALGREWNNMAYLLSKGGLLYDGSDIATGAQTERRGGAGPVRGLLGGKDPPAALF